MIWNGQGNVDYSPRQESIRRECEASLRRLKTDVIDLYQIHWVLVQFLDKYMMYKCMMHLASALPAFLCRGRFRHPSRYRKTPSVSTVCTRTFQLLHPIKRPSLE
jgi:aryl-alcohol dehydrogenase-like predicted oxidoreductase